MILKTKNKVKNATIVYRNQIEKMTILRDNKNRMETL